MLVPSLQEIFMSIQYKDLELLTPILEVYEVPKTEKELIKRFIQKCREEKYVLSKETLTLTLGIHFNEDHEPVTNIKEYIDQYIRYYKNFDVANKLLNLSRSILENGMNEETSSELEDLTKAETAQTDIEVLSPEKLLEVYERANIKKSNLSTCVRQLDEQIGGLQKGKLTSILGYTARI